MNSTSKEKELFVLEPIFKKYFLPVIFYFFILLPIVIFCITLPVLLNFSYDSVLFNADVDTTSKKIIFFSTIICYIYAIGVFPQLKMGKYYFFCDRLEVHSFLFKKIYILYYNKLYVVLHINSSCDKLLVVSPYEIPKFMKNPIKKIINEYIRGFYVIVHSYCLKDSSNIDKAIKLLRDYSTNFVVK